MVGLPYIARLRVHRRDAWGLDRSAAKGPDWSELATYPVVIQLRANRGWPVMVRPNWVAGWLGGWVAGWLGGQVAGWPGGWVAGWLSGRVAGWLSIWLKTGYWLAGEWCCTPFAEVLSLESAHMAVGGRGGSRSIPTGQPYLRSRRRSWGEIMGGEWGRLRVSHPDPAPTSAQ